LYSKGPGRFAGQRVVIVGLARQGSALARFFCEQEARVVMTDLGRPEQLRAQIDALSGLPIEYVLGEHPFTLLEGCDLLCLSGGVPPETPLPQEARRRGIPLSNDSLLTLHLSPAPLVGITGSSGKTTTTTLVGEMLKASGLVTWVGGNIGTPLIDRVSDIAQEDKVVLELSSFQLQLFDASPHVSAVLNITPNHLDRHPSMAHYAAAKANILRYQGKTVGRQPADDVAVLGVDNDITGRWWKEGRVRIAAGTGQPAVDLALNARKLGFSLVEQVAEGAFLQGDRLVWCDDGQEAEICSTGELLLLGRHNVANVLAACAISGAAGATPEGMHRVATTFAGVSHRLELVRELRGVRWYNDSIATAPERVVAALTSFAAPAEPNLILLAGGRDKHLPWEEMARVTVERVRHLVVFGEAADLIADAVGRFLSAATAAGQTLSDPASPQRVQIELHRGETLEKAVQVAARVARPGDIVLLSPGGTSFDAYRDFEERGEHFGRLVRALEQA
jgi:UDP-N-acetylmuramoylalanine--D-glutamate ligase